MSLVEQTGTANDALAAHSPVGHFVTGQVLDIEVSPASRPAGATGRSRSGRAGRPDGAAHRRRAGPQRRHGGRVGDRPRDRLRGFLPRELVQALGDAVLEATGGDPRDDSTILCLDWTDTPIQDSE